MSGRERPADDRPQRDEGEMIDAAGVALWVRMFDATEGDCASPALDGVGIHAEGCVHAVSAGGAVQTALGSLPRIVVLDSHGYPTGISRKSEPRVELDPVRLADDPRFRDVDLLILGACHQGRAKMLAAWRAVAPNAIVVASTRLVYDVRGCRLIAAVIRAAIDAGEAFTAQAATDVITAEASKRGGQQGLVAMPPLAAEVVGAEVAHAQRAYEAGTIDYRGLEAIERAHFAAQPALEASGTPSRGTLVIDGEGDAWRYGNTRWTCTAPVDGERVRNVARLPHAAVVRTYGPLRIIGRRNTFAYRTIRGRSA